MRDALLQVTQHRLSVFQPPSVGGGTLWTPLIQHISELFFSFPIWSIKPASLQRGHHFARGPGVIGTAMSYAERYPLLEQLEQYRIRLEQQQQQQASQPQAQPPAPQPARGDPPPLPDRRIDNTTRKPRRDNKSGRTQGLVTLGDLLGGGAPSGEVTPSVPQPQPAELPVKHDQPESQPVCAT